MTFPTLNDHPTPQGFSASTTHAINTSGNASSGDTLIAFLHSDSANTGQSATWPSSGEVWTELEDVETTKGSNNIHGTCAYRKSDGTETSVTVTLALSEEATGFMYELSGAADPDTTPPESSEWNSGSSNTVSTAPCTPISVTAADFKCIAVSGKDTTAGTISQPTANDNSTVEGGGQIEAAGCTDEINSTSLDPGDFTYETARPGVTLLVAVHPAAGGSSTDLVIADATHAHSADGLSLTLDTTLAIAEALHAHAADNLDLVAGTTLSIADAGHAHAADNLSLTLDTTLAIADALHAHAADNVAVTLDTTLAIAEALHAHAADNVTLLPGATLDIADALHAHGADSLSLTLDTTLAIAEALHAHNADSLTLTADVVLVINDALHAMLSDIVTLSTGDIVVIPAGTLVIDSESTTLLISGESTKLVILADDTSKVIQ